MGSYGATSGVHIRFANDLGGHAFEFIDMLCLNRCVCAHARVQYVCVCLLLRVKSNTSFSPKAVFHKENHRPVKFLGTDVNQPIPFDSFFL